MAVGSSIIAGYIFRNNLHSLFLLLTMCSLLALIGWQMADLQGVLWVLILGIILFVSCPRFSAERILNACSAEKMHYVDNPHLHLKIQQLTENAGLTKLPEIYCSQQDSINCFTMKAGDKNLIVVSKSLINKFDHAETKAVLAHEVAHIYQGDTNVMLLADKVTHFTQGLSAIGLIMLSIAPILSMQNINVPWQVIISLLLAHYITGLLQLSLSRTRELCADVIAVQLTNDVDAMVSALKKIEQQPRHWLDEMFSYRKQHSPSLLRSHPPTQDRVFSLLGLDMLSNFGH